MTTKIIEGVAMRVHTKVFTKKDGSEGQAYSMLVNTGSEEEWFNFGFSKPAVTSGTQVRFNLVQKGQYWNADSGSIEVVKTAEAAAPAVMKKAVANVDARQRSIVIQTAYKVAPEIILGALEHQLITLPTKKADKFDAYLSLIEETALHLASVFIDPPADFKAPKVDAENVSETAASENEQTPDGYGIV